MWRLYHLTTPTAFAMGALYLFYTKQKPVDRQGHLCYTAWTIRRKRLTSLIHPLDKWSELLCILNSLFSLSFLHHSPILSVTVRITSYVILSSFHPYSSLYIISPLAISSCGTFCALPYTVCLYQFTSSAASKNVVFFFLPTAWSKKISLLPFRGCGSYPLHTACFWGSDHYLATENRNS